MLGPLVERTSQRALLTLVVASLLTTARARADDPVMSLTIEAGAAWSRAASRYDSTELPEPSFDEVSAVGPAGALRLALTTRVGDVVHLGGVLRVGAAGVATSPFVAGMNPAFAFTFGPVIALFSEDAEGGPYALLWIGGGYVLPEGAGFAGGLSAGYRWRVEEHLELGVAGSLSTQWAFDEEDGDFGTYSYLFGAISPALELRVAFDL